MDVIYSKSIWLITLHVSPDKVKWYRSSAFYYLQMRQALRETMITQSTFIFFSPWTNAPSTKVPLANLNIYSCLILCTICVVMITNSASTGLLLNNQFIFVYKISQFSSARGMAALVGSLFASITDYSAQNTRKP